MLRVRTAVVMAWLLLDPGVLQAAAYFAVQMSVAFQKPSATTVSLMFSAVTALTAIFSVGTSTDPLFSVVSVPVTFSPAPARRPTQPPPSASA